MTLVDSFVCNAGGVLLHPTAADPKHEEDIHNNNNNHHHHHHSQLTPTGSNSENVEPPVSQSWDPFHVTEKDEEEQQTAPAHVILAEPLRVVSPSYTTKTAHSPIHHHQDDTLGRTPAGCESSPESLVVIPPDAQVCIDDDDEDDHKDLMMYDTPVQQQQPSSSWIPDFGHHHHHNNNRVSPSPLEERRRIVQQFTTTLQNLSSSSSVSPQQQQHDIIPTATPEQPPPTRHLLFDIDHPDAMDPVFTTPPHDNNTEDDPFYEEDDEYDPFLEDNDDDDDARNHSHDSSVTAELLNGDPFALTPQQYQSLQQQGHTNTTTNTTTASSPMSTTNPHSPSVENSYQRPSAHSPNFLQQLAVEDDDDDDDDDNRDMDTLVQSNTTHSLQHKFQQLQQQQQQLQSKQAQADFLQELAVMQAKSGDIAAVDVAKDPQSSSPRKSVAFVEPHHEPAFPQDPMAGTSNNVNLFYSDDQLAQEEEEDDDDDINLATVVESKAPNTMAPLFVHKQDNYSEKKQVEDFPPDAMESTKQNVDLFYSDNQLHDDDDLLPPELPTHSHSVLPDKETVIQETAIINRDENDDNNEEEGFEIIIPQDQEQDSAPVVVAPSAAEPKVTPSSSTEKTALDTTHTETSRIPITTTTLAFSTTEFCQSAKNVLEPLCATAVVQAQGAMTIAMAQVQQVVDDHLISPPRQKSGSSRRSTRNRRDDSYDDGDDEESHCDDAIEILDNKPSTDCSSTETTSQISQPDVSFGSAIPLTASKDPVGNHNQVSFSEEMNDTERIIIQELHNALKQSRKCLLDEEAHVKRQEIIYEAMEQDIRIAEQELHELSLKRKPDHESNMERLERELRNKMKSKKSKILASQGSIEMYEEQLQDLENQLSAKQEELHGSIFDPSMIRHQDLLAREVLTIQTAIDKTTQSLEVERRSIDQLTRSNQMLNYKLVEVRAALEECRKNSQEWYEIEAQALRAKFQHKLTKQQSLLSMARQAVESRHDELEYLQRLLDQKIASRDKTIRKPGNPHRSSTV